MFAKASFVRVEVSLAAARAGVGDLTWEGGSEGEREDFYESIRKGGKVA